MTTKNDDTLANEVRAWLNGNPDAIRVCEGGGPEDLAASFSVTIASMNRRAATQSPRIEDRAAGDVEGQREAFKAWWEKEGQSVLSSGKTTYEVAWQGYQAALASATPSATKVCARGHKEWVGECPHCAELLPAKSLNTPSAAVGASRADFDAAYKRLYDAGLNTHEVAWALYREAVTYTTPTKPGQVEDLQRRLAEAENRIETDQRLIDSLAKPNPWEQAIIEAAMITEAVSIKDRTPKQILDDVIDYHLALSGDPVAKPGRMVVPQESAVAYVNADELASLIRDAKKFGKTQYCIDAFAKPAGINTTPLYDHAGRIDVTSAMHGVTKVLSEWDALPEDEVHRDDMLHAVQEAMLNATQGGKGEGE